MQTHIDPLTQASFYPSRSNQVHLSATNRNRYWNEKSKAIRKAKAKYDKALHLNFKILSVLMEGATEKIFNRHFLLGRGFSFGVFTHQMLIAEEPMPCYYDFVLTLESNQDNIKVKRI